MRTLSRISLVLCIILANAFLTSGTVAADPGRLSGDNRIDRYVCANFEVQPTKNPCVFSFIDRSENAISYFWIFGDGKISYAQNPDHRYNTPGIYYVTLIICGLEGTASITKSVYAGVVHVSC